ncbi:4482_t:CDS:2 [Funneliformis geosporum]|uniref:4482_t:CDS:1 n=1 Tax=Funneliformis geosporum TaxID=1117311 RepID=A0A9W4WRU7_9GLOM|nr:4482_t:CDS:2 [Funneliformis geosporum]
MTFQPNESHFMNSVLQQSTDEVKNNFVPDFGICIECSEERLNPTSNYMFVMRYYENGDLYSYIDETQGMLCWRDIVNMIWEISAGIEFLHDNGFIHGNLHGGNLLIENEPDIINTYITDLGLSGPANKRNSKEIYGVLPYTDPEILKGNPPTKSSDVYSFGIIMWTLSAGIRPLCNRAHDLRLATEISLGNWVSAICDDPDSSDLSDQFDIAEEKKFSDLEKNEFLQQQIHYQANYKSRLMYFPEIIDFTKRFVKKKV